MSGLSGQSIGLTTRSSTPIGGAAAVDANSRGCMENFIGFVPDIRVEDSLPHDFVAIDDVIVAAADGTTRYAPIYAGTELRWRDGSTHSPIDVVAPVISGVGAVGQVLTTTNGEWLGEAPITFQYEWLINGVTPIAGANSQTYTVQAGAAGNNISSKVIATNAKGIRNADSVNSIHIPAP